MNTSSRTYNSIVNSTIGLATSAITVALNFVVRVFIVRQLGEEINGLNSLFQSIISMMALMEMGISSAMIIHLYEPIKKKDQDTISGIMSFYKRIYYYVAFSFALVGVLISQLLIERLVTSSIPIDLVRIYFLFFTACFVGNYLTYYKRSLLFAEQKNRISTGITAVCEIIFRGIQIVLLLQWQNYILFLLVLLVEKVVSNLICQYYVDRHHPYLRKNRSQISTEKKEAIFKTIKPLMVFQIATTLQGAAASILISILLGNVAIVGYYGVYQLIISVVTLLFSQIGAAFTTSFGNLSVDKDYEHMKAVYRKSAFIFNWFACICTITVLACSDDFVFLFFGKNFILPAASVLLLAFQMLVSLMAVPIISIQNAMGLHRYDAKAMMLQALLAITLGYIFGSFWGMPGILIGLTLPSICVLLIRKGIIISNMALLMEREEFLRIIIPDFLYISLFSILTILICKQLPMTPSLMSIVVKFMIGLFFSIGVTSLAVKVFKKSEFNSAVLMVKKHIRILH